MAGKQKSKDVECDEKMKKYDDVIYNLFDYKLILCICYCIADITKWGHRRSWVGAVPGLHDDVMGSAGEEGSHGHHTVYT